jgi:hypothetical protein
MGSTTAYGEGGVDSVAWRIVQGSAMAKPRLSGTFASGCSALTVFHSGILRFHGACAAAAATVAKCAQR